MGIGTEYGCDTVQIYDVFLNKEVMLCRYIII
jgi:hypothetical protein